MSELLIEIKDLECNIDNQKILQGLNLKINKGEVHAIMGPNGSGKSTLSSVLAGNDNYEVTNGSINFLGEEITEMSPEIGRAHVSTPVTVKSRMPSSA